MLTLAFTIFLLAQLSVGLDREELDSLNPDKNVLQKHLQQGEVWAFSVHVPPQNDSSANIMLTLSTLNDDGDADLYCLPQKLASEADTLPSTLFSVWKSTKSQGQDIIFVSIHHDLYSLVVDQTGSANLICTAMGFAMLGSDAEISLDADYSERLLTASEQKAMSSLFNKCCNVRQQRLGCLDWLNRKSTHVHFCNHRGAICDSDGHLLSLDLRKFGLECPFPLEAIQEFKFLRTLDLSQNSLTGDIEKILEGLAENLPNLVIIDFSLNDLGGSLGSRSAEAAICSMTHADGALRLLNLESNFIEGQLPSCLFDASSNLREIVMGGSHLNGQVPEISVESSIQIVRLDNTGLKGTIPEVLGDLQSLAVLDLSDNFLIGSLPSNIGNPQQLRTLRLEANTLQGMIPDSIALSRSLSVVRLEVNELTSFPDAFYVNHLSASSVLKVFDASRNRIEGEFPMFLSTAPKLTVLNLADNKLTGLLPNHPGMFPEVIVLQLGSNQFGGPLPDALGGSRLFDLQAGDVSIAPQLDLSGNNLVGQIPSFLTNLPPGTIMPVMYFQGNSLEMDCFGDLTIRASVVQSGVSCSEDTLPRDHGFAPLQELDNLN